MKQHSKRLYEKIMRNVSKEVKKVLNEDIQKFDVSDYIEDDGEILSHQDIMNFSYNYFPENKQELKEILIRKIKENKFGNETLLYPDLSDIDTEKITDMTELFNGLLINIKIPVKLILCQWNTSNVISMLNMFADCVTLTELNLKGFDTSNVINMNGMFVRCEKLVKLDISSFDTSNVINMSGLFYRCKSLTELDLSNFDTSSVTNMSYMFSDCEQLKNIKLSNFDTSNVTNMNYMFNCCKSLEKLDLSNFNTFNVTSMISMFSFCKVLNVLDLSHFDSSNITNMRFMFSRCENLNTIYTDDEKIKKKFKEIKGITESLQNFYKSDIHNFDVGEYGDDEYDIIDHQTVDKLTQFSEFFKAINNIKKLNIQGDIKHVLLPTMKIMLDVCDYKHLTNESDLEYYYDFSQVGDSLDLNEIKEFLDNNDYDFEISLIFNYDYDYYYEEFPSYSLTDIEVIYARKVIEDFISIQSLQNQYNIEKEVDNEKISVYIQGDPVYDGQCMMYLSDAFNNLMIYFNKYLEYLKTKLKLNEDLQKFDVTEYDEDPDEIVDYNTIKQVNKLENINDTLILWSDLNTYTLEDIINDVPESGYPIGINVLHNKYVSLKYMSIKNPEKGANTHKDIVFSYKEVNKAPNVEFHEDVLLNSDEVRGLQVKIQNNKSGTYYKSIDSKKVVNTFKYFDGINQTNLILDDIESYQSMHDYPAAECIYEFNPGKTKKGDWYLPEIGELSYIYILKPVIEYICSILIDMGYKDIYDRIWGVWYWSSTFYNLRSVYRMLMTDGRTSDMYKHIGNDTAALAMYEV